jgi:hypothetical protein
MKRIDHSFGVAIVLVMVATSSVYGQTFLGVTIGTTLATSSRTDVSDYGNPSRMLYGLRASTTIRKGMELVGSIGLRSEEGGFVTPFVRNAARRPIGMVNVVDNPSGGPVVVSSLVTSAIELTAALRIPLARVDTSGSYFGVQLGALVDQLTSAEQTDDYTGILPGDRGSIPDRVATSYTSQIGGGAVIGGVLVLNTGAGRLVLDITYVTRGPESLPVPTPRTGGSSEQYVGWLVGNGLRFSAGFDLGL